MERMVVDMKIIKQELEFEECLKQRLEFICEFSKVTPTFINGSIRKLDKTNLTYIEPHRELIRTIYGTDDIVNDVKQVYLEEFEQARIEYNNKQIGVPIIENCTRGMKKQVGKSKLFTKTSLTEIQDKMRNACIKSYNKFYEVNTRLKEKT